MAMSPAMESIFANAQQNAASLIETATLAINAKVNTIEEAEKMIQDLSSEAVKYNELLKDIANAMHQVESGDMSKEEAAGIIAPAVKELKDKCCALKIANVEAPGDDITEDEIAILRELIIGAKAAAEDRLVAIRLGDDDKVDPEIEAEVNTPDEDKAEESIKEEPKVEAEIAIEGKIGDAFKKHKENKAKINTLWDSFKDKRSEAILAQFAKAAAPKCTGKADIKAFVAEMISEDEKSGKDYTGKLTAKDYIVKSYGGITMAIMPGNPDKTGCAHILAPIHDDAGDCFFFKREICNIMLNPAKKEAPAQESIITENKYIESEEMKMILTDEYDQRLDAAVLESMNYEDAAMATEGTNWEQHKMKKSYQKECRAMAKEAKKMYRLGKYSEAKTLYEKCAKLCDEFAAEIKSMPQDAKDLQWGAWMHWLRVMFVASDSSTDTIDRKIELLNKQGKGNLKHGDFNDYTASLAAEAKRLAGIYRKLAAKAGKGAVDTASESTGVETLEDIMTALEGYVEEIEAMIPTAATEGEECSEEECTEGAPKKKVGDKIRGGFAKIKGAFKSSKKKAAKDAAEKAAEAFGVPAIEMYDLLLECFEDAE